MLPMVSAFLACSLANGWDQKRSNASSRIPAVDTDVDELYRQPLIV
ncbi:MAG: hypothetical protein JSS49_20275 [Planctomycetes bacterium]|nr:hypothetical protein [Planctomycetota bacterium]